MSGMSPGKDQFPVIPNLSAGQSWKGKTLFFLRQAADMMVASVVKFLRPWLAERHGCVLDVGCGAQPYRHLLPADCLYQGLDWEGAADQFAYQAPDTLYYDGKTFPFVDQHFDALFHTEVLEHVYDYAAFLTECKRVLKPGGCMFFSVPFTARYHYIPNDYWRYTPATLHKLLTAAGFEAVTIRTRGTDLTVAAYKIISIVYRWLLGRFYQKILGVLALPFAAISLVLGQITLQWNIGSTDDCLGYVVTAQVHLTSKWGE